MEAAFSTKNTAPAFFKKLPIASIKSPTFYQPANAAF
jgi:hypothetical protein